jgi:hypothetical protein
LLAGVFDWLQQQGRVASLIRQVSNPMAGCDTTLLALAGTGFSARRAFGFMSCERVVGAAEGMNVLQVSRHSGFTCVACVLGLFWLLQQLCMSGVACDRVLDELRACGRSSGGHECAAGEKQPLQLHACVLAVSAVLHSCAL